MESHLKIENHLKTENHLKIHIQIHLKSQMHLIKMAIQKSLKQILVRLDVKIVMKS